MVSSSRRSVLVILGIVLLAVILRDLAVRRLPVDFDEPVYGEAGLVYAEAIRAGDLDLLARGDPAPEHPGLVKLLYGGVFLLSPSLWADGRHESLFAWEPMGDYLSDAAGAGDFVPLTPVDSSPIGAESAIAGLFRRAAAPRAQEATLVFAPGATLSHLWVAATTGGGARLIGDARPAPGDVFQPSRLISRSDGTQTVTFAAGPARDFFLAAGDFAVVSETSGLMFSNDILPIKVRDEFALGVNGHRGIGKRNVS